MRHPHIQSVLASWSLRGRWLKSAARSLLAVARTELVECGDGVRLAGRYSPQAEPTRGLAVLLHGWEGCAEANYVVSMGSKLYACGFEVFRLNFRDHGQTQGLNPGLFHSCRIDEVAAAVAAIQRAHPAESTVLIGHSLGGNFALRVAARQGRAAPHLERVFAICPVLEPSSTMRALEEGLWIYRHYFLRRWRRSLRAKARCFPERYDFGDLGRLPTLTATTDFFVRRYTEYPDLDAYLRGYAITGPVLKDLDTPAEIIVAADDPVIPIRDLERLARSPALTIHVAARGGHCGFLENYRLASWVDRAILAGLGLADSKPAASQRKSWAARRS